MTDLPPIASLTDRIRLQHELLGAGGGLPSALVEGPEIDRDSYLGGTDVAAILGKNPFKSPLDVYLRKTKQAPPEPVNERMTWGLILEPIILAEYCRRAGLCLVESQPFVRDNNEPWLGGHIDGVARPVELDPNDPDQQDRVATIDDPRGLMLLEAKAVRREQLPKWENGIPTEYQYQGQHYLMLRDLDLCVFVVLFGGQILRAYPMARNKAMHEEIRCAGRNFWADHVVPRIPPSEPDRAGEEPESDPDAVSMPASSSAIVAAHTIVSAKAKAKEWEATIDSARQVMIDELEALGVDALTVDGKPIFTKSTRSRAAYTVEAKEWTQYEMSRSAAKILAARA